MSMSDVTDEVDKTISSVKNNTVPDIDHEMAEHLRMDLSESDVHERVIQYFKLCHEIIDDHGWNIFFTEEQAMCSILIKSLESKALCEEVDRTARFQTRKAREDEVTLHDLILEKALDHEKVYQSNRRAKHDRDRGDRDSENPAARTNGKNRYRSSECRMNPAVQAHGPSKCTLDRPKKNRLLLAHIAAIFIGYTSVQALPIPKRLKFLKNFAHSEMKTRSAKWLT
ncbi:LOW QUALITY PROTEIN: hypothetical protein PHMEG_0009582 [Phytophthora megakarya]|uniref:Uncharacterized protein n=1 Tax=Phytophthora megakarya TaxID=4795 RepID=A0A225WH79_9STRA|nr:LOW QUALITY PROTEIN: hypothetical protein PHMEG_0009582 [Phytophthora megakarya]